MKNLLLLVIAFSLSSLCYSEGWLTTNVGMTGLSLTLPTSLYREYSRKELTYDAVYHHLRTRSLDGTQMIQVGITEYPMLIKQKAPLSCPDKATLSSENLSVERGYAHIAGIDTQALTCRYSSSTLYVSSFFVDNLHITITVAVSHANRSFVINDFWRLVSYLKAP